MIQLLSVNFRPLAVVANDHYETAISHKYLYGSREMRFAREGRGGEERGGSSWELHFFPFKSRCLVVEMIISDDNLSFGSQLSDTKYQFPVAANCPHLINYRIHLKQKYVWEGDTVFRCPDWTCKTRICKTWTCKRRTCKTLICKTRTCRTRFCKRRRCKTRTWYFFLLKR